MSDVVAVVLNIPEPFVKAVTIPVASPIKVVQLVTAGIQGGKGEAGTPAETLTLAVTSNGQTQFTVFSIPTSSYLTVNGVVYYKDIDYTVGVIGPNIKLTWAGSYTLSISDFLVFHYIN